MITIASLQSSTWNGVGKDILTIITLKLGDVKVVLIDISIINYHDLLFFLLFLLLLYKFMILPKTIYSLLYVAFRPPGDQDYQKSEVQEQQIGGTQILKQYTAFDET